MWLQVSERAASLKEDRGIGKYEPMMTSPDLPSCYGRIGTQRFFYKIRIDMHERVLGRDQLTRLSEVGRVLQ